jgi:phytoene dehydrogenase-like protein
MWEGDFCREMEPTHETYKRATDACGPKRPSDRFALGLDQPTYFSVHSAAARLAPRGVAVVCLMKYLRGEAGQAAAGDEAELETFLDQLQPGWREHVIARRFLPRMTVCPTLPRADDGGLLGRPGVSLGEQSNIFLVGDWVGPVGTLADAAAASAEQAATPALARLGTAPAAPASSHYRESVLDVGR